MSTDQTDDQARRAALHTLDRLIGSWAVDGPDTSGTVSYTWFDNEAFLVQTIDLRASDATVTRGVEYIGWDRASRTLRSHFFGNSGEILEYTYDLTGDTLTIWFGTPDSPARFVGTFDSTGNRNLGGWEWPGGGYESNMTRIPEGARLDQ